MTKRAQQKSGQSSPYAEMVTAVTVAHRAVVNAENATGRKMVDAGLALIAALDKGAVTFDRVTGEALTALRANGVMTKGDLASHLKTSPTMLSKYRTVGQAVGAGVTPETVDKSDWTRFTQQAASKWAAEAAATGDKATILRAIADHRPGAGKSTQKNGQTAGKAKGSKAPKPAAAKPEVPNVTKATLEQDVARVVAYLTANNGKRLDTVNAESLATIHALLVEGAESVEAAQHRKSSKATAPAATLPVAV